MWVAGVLVAALTGCVRLSPSGGTPPRSGAGTSPACSRARGGRLPPDFDALDLAGTYTVVSHLYGEEGEKSYEARIWLWPTSGGDSSRTTGKGAQAGDTIHTPLFGTFLPDPARNRAIADTMRRASVDPVYPPVLVHRYRSRAADSVQEQDLLMFVSSQNRRDGVMVLDGGGAVLFIQEIARDGFRGVVRPAGMVVSDTGYFCASRTGRQ